MPKLTSDTMLSCSQLPSLFGVSPYSSPNDVLMFCMKSILGEDARTQAGEAADWGNALEPAIIAEMAKRLGIDRYVMPDKAFQHPNLALAASADAIAYIDKPMVINHDPSKGIYVVDGDGPIQVQGVMMCTTLHWAAIGCLYSGVELRIFLFKPHPETMAQIENLAIDFQGRLTTFEETGEAQYYPAADSKDANRIWPTAREEEVQLGIDAEDLVADIVLAKNKIASIQEDIDMWEKDLKVMMKDYSSAKVGHWSIKWPMRHYKATPEKITPPKEAYSVRQSTLTIKESK